MTVYLKLMHGRNNPEQHMDDWGFDGPVLGPFEAVHFTYATHARCFPKGSEGDSEALELCYHDDMLMHDGKYYGDLEIAASFGSDTPKLSPELLDVLGLCENALADLARLDDGTTSVAALHAVRAAIAKATT
jgi:hypothetical protein